MINKEVAGVVCKEADFDHINVGMAVPCLKKKPTEVSLFRFSAAVWLHHRIHYDHQFTQSVGLRGPLVHGPLQAGYLIQMIMDWLGEKGTLKSLSFKHHIPAVSGDVLTCRGMITNKWVEDGKGSLEIDLSIENQNKKIVTTGKAKVYMPLK